MSAQPDTQPDTPPDTQPEAQPVRLAVVAGSPDAGELAASTVSLLGLASASAPPPARGPDPGWPRAARLEGIGGAPFTSAADPRLA